MSGIPKRRLAVAGGFAVCLVLAALIAAQFAGESPGDLSTADRVEGEVSTQEPGEPEKEDVGSSDAASGPSSAAQPATEDSAPEPAAQKNGQGAEFDEETTTDTTHPPEDTPVIDSPQTDHASSTPSPSVPAGNEPSNGDTKDGMIFIEGFGWIENHGGGTNAIEVDSDGDINKMVGNMG